MTVTPAHQSTITKRYSFSKTYFRFNANLLKIVGLLPFDSRFTYLSSILTFSTVLASLFLLLPTIHGFVNYWQQIGADERNEIITVEEEIMFVAVLAPRRERVSKLLRRCENLWKSVENQSEFEAMKPFVNWGRYITYGFAYTVIAITTHFVVAAPFSWVTYNVNGTSIRSKHLPFSAGIIHQNQVIFYGWYALQVLAAMLGICNLIAIDAAIAVLILHAAAHMRLLRFRLGFIASHPKANQVGRITNLRAWDNYQAKKIFRDCILHHQKILDYCQDLEDVINPVLLLQTILGMTTTAVDGINLLKTDGDRSKYGAHLIGAIGQLLIFCWPPDILNDESSAVTQAVYSVPWTSWSTRDQKTIYIVMMRAQKAPKLTAGKFITMSLHTFSGVISKAISFFTVLRRMM